ncbi:hypothetical protein [Halopenitus malekzadehii]|uniref:hypothetical protein n=1 Tax=Halopenitus malekzadehii TaxID=1267564 RepID=UPI0015A6668F|nr:hypothetical protein [Halopenitus malekzadehii]
MRKTPRSRRARRWAGLYVGLFGAPDDVAAGDTAVDPRGADDSPRSTETHTTEERKE